MSIMPNCICFYKTKFYAFNLKQWVRRIQFFQNVRCKGLNPNLMHFHTGSFSGTHSYQSVAICRVTTQVTERRRERVTLCVFAFNLISLSHSASTHATLCGILFGVKKDFF